MTTPVHGDDWRTKPTDGFILKWIKLYLSAPVTRGLCNLRALRPWMITLASSTLGMAAGLVFALGHGWQAGCLAVFGQVLDGVDGQLARLTKRASPAGAFWDSVLDRYADGGLLIGMIVYVGRINTPLSPSTCLIIGALAVIGSNLISYTTARAESLGLDSGRPTLVSKGTRTTAMILGGWGSIFWPTLPFYVLIYLALHTNLVVISRLARASRGFK